jgi:3D-(3,5/4)-trihydroxycyclohexane-1,2-dione acylhydrolase (decyclizing)
MKTVRLTTAQAIVRYLMAQQIEIDGELRPLFAGAFAIFGHGNVTCLGPALHEVKDTFPTWRGQNEQGMALAAVAYAKAMRRRQIMVATSSIGPGATNMVTAAAVAHANRLPVLLLSGDTFASRIPDPVLQQVESFTDPSATVNDSFKPVTRFWDRIVTPEQVVHSLPHAVATMLDPATCGPAFIALPQDVQAEAYDYPVRLFEPQLQEIPRPRPDTRQLARAAAALAGASKPLIIAGGGVHYSLAEDELRTFAERHNIPVVETVAGKATLVSAHPLNAGPIGSTGCTSANAMAAEADVVLAVGTRLQDFTTGSWTVFANESAQIIGLNTATFDAVKHLSIPLVADAREGLLELTAAVGDWRAPDSWTDKSHAETAQYHAYIDKIASPTAPAQEELPTYAQVIGAIDRAALPTDYAFAAAGGFPGELNSGWRAKGQDSIDMEYGYSCMGYEISGAWGAKMAMPEREVIVFVGDGSYLMMNSDLFSSVLSGHKLIVIVCDNGGFAVINRLQVNQGGLPFNNLIADAKVERVVAVDFAAHAAAMGCEAETANTIAELEAAFERARASDRTYVIAMRTSAYDWTGGGSFWEVGVPEVSDREEIVAARATMDAGKAAQRVGW